MSRRTRRGCPSPKPWPVGEAPPKTPVLDVRLGAATEDCGVGGMEATVETINRRHYFRNAPFEQLAARRRGPRPRALFRASASTLRSAIAHESCWLDTGGSDIIF